MSGRSIRLHLPLGEKGELAVVHLHYFIYDTFKAFRMNQESWQVQSLDIYKDIRRIAAIYNANAQEQNKRLAEWDTTRSHKYAWKVIGVIALKGDKELPERKRLIFWAGDIGQKKKRVLLQDGSVIYLPLPR